MNCCFSFWGVFFGNLNFNIYKKGAMTFAVNLADWGTGNSENYECDFVALNYAVTLLYLSNCALTPLYLTHATMEYLAQ